MEEKLISVIMTKEEMLKFFSNKIVEQGIMDCSEFNTIENLEDFGENIDLTKDKDKILENCKIDLQKDLKKASLHIDKKKDKKSKVKEIYILIKNCIDYLFATESAIDIILHVENSQISTLLEGLGYDILSLGEDDKGLYLYSIFKEPLEEE